MFLHQATPLLCIFLFMICKFAEKTYAQSGGDDSLCLTGFLDSAHSSLLSTWTPSNLKNPCVSSSASFLLGVGCNNNRVYSLTLNASGLVGTISPSLANCSLLETIDISSNQLSGNIPKNIGNLTYLTSLNFSNNRLDGPIPTELGSCAYLNVIDLNQNKLSGSIPPQLGLLQRLKYFDVSDNDLSGPVPTTLSNTSTGAPRFNASSFDGNSDLYGYPLPPASSHGLSVLAIVCIGLASGLISLFVSFTAVCLWLRITEQGYAAQEGKISQLMSES